MIKILQSDEKHLWERINELETTAIEYVENDIGYTFLDKELAFLHEQHKLKKQNLLAHAYT